MMANSIHVSILEKGVEYWNLWRLQNPKISPDLSGIVLSETKTYLNEIDKKYEKKDFQGIDFSNTDFSRSILRGINLNNANLENSLFYRADLRKANMQYVNLKNAKLNLTNLTLVDLTQAIFYKTLFWETIISRTNLSDAIGLEFSKHGGPSIIDHRTFKKSKKISSHFLKGIGLPDNLIQFYKHKSTNKHSYQSCFISYSSNDEIFVNKLYNALQKNGIRCWFAPENLNVGDKYRETIENAITSYDKVIIVLSKDSILSGWVEDEIEATMEKEYLNKTVVTLPISIDESYLNSNISWVKKIKRTRHVQNFDNWLNQKEFNNSVKKLLKGLH